MGSTRSDSCEICVPTMNSPQRPKGSDASYHSISTLSDPCLLYQEYILSLTCGGQSNSSPRDPSGIFPPRACPNRQYSGPGKNWVMSTVLALWLRTIHLHALEMWKPAILIQSTYAPPPPPRQTQTERTPQVEIRAGIDVVSAWVTMDQSLLYGLAV